MKFNKKRVKVVTKLYLRALKRSPHLAAVGVMAFCTFGLTSFVAYQSIKQADRFSASTFSLWSDFQKNHGQRSIASADGEICQHSKVNPGLLDQEIRKLESEYETGHFIEGNWYGVNLKSLPSIQAQMLADHGNLVGNKAKSQNFRSCQDAVCVFNKIYKDNSGLSGKIVYYWYLKTGSMISLSNYVPGQVSKQAGVYRGKNHGFKDYLFSQNELRKLYILAKSLPTSFAHNPLFKSLHKIPNVSALEGRQECAASLPSGQVLIGQSCLEASDDGFMSSVANHIAKYVDQYHALGEEKKTFSQTEKWLASSLWLREEIWDHSSKEYKYVWRAHSKENGIAVDSSPSPGEQFSKLLSDYRFSPESFKSQTASDIAAMIKNDFFAGESYDANGLFNLYVNQSIDQWSRKEAGLWEDCVEKHFDPKQFEKGKRDIASSIENPLYSCIEKKIPEFEQEMMESIQKRNAQGCAFFNDGIKYGHVAKRYREAMDKFLMEKILQRKIELQRHGVEVLAGQKAKQEFLEIVDPTSVFIECHAPEGTRECYEKNIDAQLVKVLNRHRDLSDYYRNVVKEDILNLFSYDQIQKRTREIAKKFIAPFYSQVHFASKHIWESCKAEGANENHKIQLPLQFSGGRHYVNAKLLNCVNEKMDDELYQIVNLGAFQEEGENKLEFKLNEREKAFAMTFMKGKMRQIFSGILDEEVSLEKGKLASHFADRKNEIIKGFKESGELLSDIYSFKQVEDKCLEKVADHYPENFFYHAKSEVDQSYGRKICSAYTESPENASIIMAEVGKKWSENQKVALTFLEEEFNDLVDDCRGDFDNPRMLQICVEESYKSAMALAIEDWRDEDEYEFFAHKENELINQMVGMGRMKVNLALK